MSDLLQIIGALLILLPFAWSQLHSLSPASVRYLLPNLAGSVLLAWLALEGAQWGFLLMETVWAAVSLRGLLRAAAGSPST